MSAGTSGKQLTDCPSNLKEAIDWILRVTGKDGQRGGDSTKGLADAFEKLLQGVKASDSTLQEKFQEIKQALKIDGNNGIVNALGEGLKKFRDDIHQTKGHQNNVYKELNSHPNLATEVPKAAKIFFGCVPLCFYGLSYLYWRCSDKGGGWHDQRFSSTGIHTDLKDFMVGMGFKSSELNGSMAGSKIVGTPFTKLQQFKTISANKTSYPALLKSIQMSPSPTLNQHPLSSLHLLASTYFTHKQSKADSPPTGSPKSIREMLYFLAALPFSSVYDAFDTYITDHFKTLLKKPEEANDENLKLDVADSSKPSSGGNDTLSAAELKQYLHTSCSFSAIVLGRFQGHGITGNDSDDPWLHKLFCNSEFAFNFPSTPILFSKLSEYTYALQFQLTFLHEQCSRSPVHGCGWRACKYGQSINNGSSNRKTVESHICPVKCAKNEHNNPGNHPKGCEHKQCGEDSNSSPLQAFLTDCLDGFCRQHPGTSDHLSDHPPGAMCHVKMGFYPIFLRPTTGTGRYIYHTLDPFCGSHIFPLRQLCEKLSCLTKRTPRNLGDVFGFYLQLVGQLFDGRMTLEALLRRILASFDMSKDFQLFAINRYPQLQDTYDQIVKQQQSLSRSSLPPVPSGLSRSLKVISKNLPFWFQLLMVDTNLELPLTLFDLRQHCHNKQKDTPSSEIKHIGPGGEKQCDHSGSNSPGDLWSVCYPIYDAQKYPNCKDGKCGGYLFPLTQSTGATYAPKFALTYFSWVLYLADELQTGLQELLYELTNIDCRHSGCKTKSNSTCQCTPGQHGTMGGKQCQCDSVVQCGGVLPLIYRHGLQFMDAKTLNGGKNDGHSWESDNNIKRTCAKFSTQLSNVLAENAPLDKLITTIDEFMYYVRYRFMSMVSSFWLCSLAILLYFIFYGIDVLHLQSHVHLPSSHTVPPIGLLTTGKAPALTKLTYYMP